MKYWFWKEIERISIDARRIVTGRLNHLAFIDQTTSLSFTIVTKHDDGSVSTDEKISNFGLAVGQYSRISV